MRLAARSVSACPSHRSYARPSTQARRRAPSRSESAHILLRCTAAALKVAKLAACVLCSQRPST
eukprot:121342-Hanusia_phi.AAC.1